MARAYTLPAPLGGLNGRDPINAMAETDALQLENMIPGVKNLALRKGQNAYYALDGNKNARTDTLVTYTQADGTEQLIHGEDDALWKVDSGSDTFSSIGTGFTSARWQTVQFREKLIFVNGDDQPQQWDGTSLTAATYTGITDDADLKNVGVYKSRLYFVEKDSQSIWYGDVDAITGALTEFDIGSFLKLGGHVLWAGSKTKDTGAGFEDVFTIVTSEGEILLYSGSNPEDAAWALVGRFEIAKPFDERSFLNDEGDLLILTRAGVLTLSTLFNNPTLEDESYTTYKIQEEFRDAVESYGDNTGWEIYRSKLEDMLWIIVPDDTSSTYVLAQHTVTKGWTKLTFYWDVMNCVDFAGYLTMGSSTSRNTRYNGHIDYLYSISFVVRYAYGYFGNPETTKHFTMARATVDRGTPFGSTGIDFDISVDFEDTTPTNELVVGANDIETTWVGLSNVGKAGSIYLGGSNSNYLEISAITVVFNEGGIL